MNKKGQNLIEFLLVVGLIAIVCIFVLTTFGQNIFTNLSLTSTNVKGFQPFGTDPGYKPNVVPGNLGGTYESPKQQVKDGSVDIDYGSYVLSGIPADFSDFVEVNGSSGGTDVFAGLYEQLADQLKEKGDTDGYSEFMKLAELTRMVADMQKQDEKAAQNCKTTTGTASGATAHSCFQTYYNTNQPPELRDTLNTVLTSYNTNAKDHDVMVFNNLGVAKHAQISDPSEYETLKTTYPSYALVDTFDSIMANAKYDDELKSITTKIYQNIGDITTNHSVYSGNYGFGVWDLPTVNYDPTTGDANAPIDFGWDTYNTEGLSEIMNPTSSSETNVAAALLCTSSKDYLNGGTCK